MTIDFEAACQCADFQTGPLDQLHADELRITTCEALLAQIAGLKLHQHTRDWAAAVIAASGGSFPRFDRVLLMERLYDRLGAGSFNTPLGTRNQPGWLTGLWVAGSTDAESLVNVAVPSGPRATIHGSVPIVHDRYFDGTGNATVGANYIDTGLVVGTTAGAFNLAGGLYVWQASDTRDSHSRMIGLANAKAWLDPASAGQSKVRVAPNAGSYVSTKALVPNGVGDVMAVMRRDDLLEVYRNGQLVESLDPGVTHVDTTGQAVWLLRSGNQYGKGRAFAFAVVAEAFSTIPNADDVQAFHDTIAWYARQVGAGI